jgi:hypothetical protein
VRRRRAWTEFKDSVDGSEGERGEELEVIPPRRDGELTSPTPPTSTASVEVEVEGLGCSPDSGLILHTPSLDLYMMVIGVIGVFVLGDVGDMIVFPWAFFATVPCMRSKSVVKVVRILGGI